MENGEQERKGLPENGFMKKVDREKGFQRAAEFILLLEKEKAAVVLSQLSNEEVEGIMREILQLKNIDATEAKKVRAE